MLDLEGARQRVREMDLGAGCGVARPLEYRLRDVACALLTVQAETLEQVATRAERPGMAELLRWVNRQALRTRAAIKRLEAERG